MIGQFKHSNKQTDKNPALPGNNYFFYRSRLTQLKTLKPMWEHSRGSTEFPIKIWGKSVKELWSDMQTNKQR